MTWDDFQLLDRIAALGTLTAAAAALEVDQTTASRRLARLERAMGVTLFDRIDGRLVATPALTEAQSALAAMAEAASRAEAALKHRRAELEGRVRVSSVGFILTHGLAPALGNFRQAHPRIAIDLMAENRNASFERREADIALRLARPRDEPALARKIATVRYRLYAGRTAEADPPVMRYGDDYAHLPEMQFLDEIRPGAFVALRSNRMELLHEAAATTGAVVVLPEMAGDADGRLARVATRPDIVERELFLLVHPDRRRAASVATVVTWIEQTIAAQQATAGTAGVRGRG